VREHAHAAGIRHVYAFCAGCADWRPGWYGVSYGHWLPFPVLTVRASQLAPNYSAQKMNSDSPPPNSPPATGALRLQDTIRLSANGVAKVLGDLEARVLQAVWDLETASPARRVFDLVSRDHAVAQLTVITVLNKLVTKGLLRRERVNDLYHYSAALSREEFTARMSRRVVEGILSLGPRAVAASMVDVLAEGEPGQLEELARLVSQKLKDRG